MAQFNPIVTTLQGKALMAKVASTPGLDLKFTKFSTSKTQYQPGANLEALTALTNVEQTENVTNVSFIEPDVVNVRTMFTNEGITDGYYVQTIGLYAIDPDFGEILFSVVTALQADWMPPNTSPSVASMIAEQHYAVSNAVNVSLTVDPTGIATIKDVMELDERIKLKQDAINASGMLKGDGKGVVTEASPGSDYGFPLKKGGSNPTPATVGAVGQHYLNTTTSKEFICTVVAGNVYTWRLAGISDTTDIYHDGTPLNETLDSMSSTLSGTVVLKGAIDPTSTTSGAVGQSYLNTESGVMFVCVSVSSGVYTWRPQSGGVLAEIIVTSDDGATVTAVSGSSKITGVVAGTAISLVIPHFGNWTVQATLAMEASDPASVSVETSKQYTVNLPFTEKIIGVEWDYVNPSTALKRLTRANDPNGLVTVNISTEPTPAVGSGVGSSPFDTLMPWMGMDEFNVLNNTVMYRKGSPNFSRTQNDTVVRIPKFWYKVEKDTAASKMRFYVSSGIKVGFSVHPAFLRGDGKERDYIYAGKYNTGAGYVSKSGLPPLVNITRAAARAGSASKGDPWWQYDYAAWSAIWLLYLVEYADWNSQTKIGRGHTSGSAAISNGGCDSMIYHTGRAAGTDGQTAVQYRGLENLWGNVFDWVDGCNINNRQVYLCLNPVNFADDTETNYPSTGVTISSTDGYIKEIGISNVFPFAFVPTASGGSETTYIPDRVNSYTGWRTLYVGGYWSNAGNAGLFCFYVNYSASNTSSYIGTRLLVLP